MLSSIINADYKGNNYSEKTPFEKCYVISATLQYMIQYITTYPGITYESYNLFISYGVLTLSKNSATTTKMRFLCLYIDVFILYHVRLQNKHYILFITVNKNRTHIVYQENV